MPLVDVDGADGRSCTCERMSTKFAGSGQVITFVTSEGLVNLSDSRGLFQGLTVRVSCIPITLHVMSLSAGKDANRQLVCRPTTNSRGCRRCGSSSQQWRSRASALGRHFWWPPATAGTSVGASMCWASAAACSSYQRCPHAAYSAQCCLTWQALAGSAGLAGCSCQARLRPVSVQHDTVAVNLQEAHHQCSTVVL